MLITTMDIFTLPYDIHTEISRYLDVVDMGRMRQTCAYWRQFLQPALLVSDRELSRRKHVATLRHDNPFMKLLLNKLKLTHNWIDLSRSKYVTMHDVLTHSTLPWNAMGLACNPNITMYHVNTWKTFRWNSRYLTANPNITFDDIIANPKYDWDWDTISQNVESCEIVKKYPNFPWSKLYLIINSKLKMLDRLHLFREFGDSPPSLLHRVALCNAMPLITIECILQFHDLSWNWRHISRQANISVDDVINNPQFPWDWVELTRNSNITINDIVKHPECNWDAKGIGQKHGFTMKTITHFLKKEIRVDWDWKILSQHSIISFNDLIKCRELPWDYSLIFDNPHINFDCKRWKELPQWNWPKFTQHSCVNLKMILDNSDLPWDYKNVQNNRNITIGELLRHYDLFGPLKFKSINYAGRITIHDVLQIKTKYLNWQSLSRVIPLEDILRHPHLPWVLENIS